MSSSQASGTPQSLKSLNIDPGFKWLGWSVTALAATSDQDWLLAMELVRTDKSDKKLGIRVADDNFSRARLIASELWDAIDYHEPDIICFEAFSPVRHASVAAQLGMAYGVLAAIAAHTGLPVASATPQQVKKAVGGKSKEQVTAAMMRKYGEQEAAQAFLIKYEDIESNHNHAWDSLAVLEAVADNETMRSLRHRV